MNRLASAVLITCTLALYVVPAFAQSEPPPAPAWAMSVTVPLPGDGRIRFNPDGSFAVTTPGFNVGGSTGGSAGGLRTPQSPAPSAPPQFDVLASFAEEMSFNVRRCLTLNGIQCSPAHPRPERSTT